MKNYNKILHLSLFSVSTYMSVMMFILIANSLTTKIAMGLLALIFELTKLTDLHRIQSIKKMRLIFSVSYTFKALLSIIASVGLVLTLLTAQNDIADVKGELKIQAISIYDDEVDFWGKELQQLDKTVTLLNENLERNPEGYGIASKSFVAQIEAIQERKEESQQNYTDAIQSRLEKLSEVSMATIEINPADMFFEIGSVFRIDHRILRMGVFVLIMILIEVSLALTGIESDDVRHSERQNYSTSNPTSEKSVKKNTPVRKRNTSFEIVRQQALCEKNDVKLLTQSEIAEKLGKSSAVINNTYRRHIKPIMIEKGFKTYCELFDYLKRAN